jgi:hypothetical protein
MECLASAFFLACWPCLIVADAFGALSQVSPRRANGPAVELCARGGGTRVDDALSFPFAETTADESHGVQHGNMSDGWPCPLKL